MIQLRTDGVFLFGLLDESIIFFCDPEDML